MWDPVLSAVDVQEAEMRSERLLMEFEFEAITFGETKLAEEKDTDVEMEIMMNNSFFWKFLLKCWNVEHKLCFFGGVDELGLYKEMGAEVTMVSLSGLTYDRLIRLMIGSILS